VNYCSSSVVMFIRQDSLPLEVSPRMFLSIDVVINIKHQASPRMKLVLLFSLQYLMIQLERFDKSQQLARAFREKVFKTALTEKV
jgi:hypothetical protein